MGTVYVLTQYCRGKKGVSSPCDIFYVSSANAAFELECLNKDYVSHVVIKFKHLRSLQVVATPSVHQY